jgi:hypothetical protein
MLTGSAASTVRGFHMPSPHVCAQAYGAKNYPALGTALQQATLILWLMCIPIGLLWLQVAAPLLPPAAPPWLPMYGVAPVDTILQALVLQRPAQLVATCAGCMRAAGCSMRHVSTLLHAMVQSPTIHSAGHTGSCSDRRKDCCRVPPKGYWPPASTSLAAFLLHLGPGRLLGHGTACHSSKSLSRHAVFLVDRSSEGVTI